MYSATSQRHDPDDYMYATAQLGNNTKVLKVSPIVGTKKLNVYDKVVVADTLPNADDAYFETTLYPSEIH